jgi:hypothetical protein
MGRLVPRSPRRKYHYAELKRKREETKKARPERTGNGRKRHKVESADRIVKVQPKSKSVLREATLLRKKGLTPILATGLIATLSFLAPIPD